MPSDMNFQDDNNVLAGPSRITIPTKVKRPEDEADSDETTAAAAAKKQKFSRSRTACLQCRSRKSKCGALPPDPCPNCVAAKLTCQWPSEDGRSSKARMVRAQMSLLGHNAGGGLEHNADMMNLGPTPDGAGGTSDDRWLERLLNRGQGQGQGQGHMTSPNQLDPFALSSSYPTAPTPYTAPSHFGCLHSGFTPPVMAHDASSGPPSSTDPSHFIWAVSSQLPQIEEPSPSGSIGSQPTSALNPNQVSQATASSNEKIVKVTWWRPHGQTAIAPGLKKITLKVRVQDHQAALKAPSPHAAFLEMGDVPQNLIGADGMPTPPIMQHLLEVFMVHLGSQFPFLDRDVLVRQVEARTGSAFLFNCIAAVAARFSTHPAIARPALPPHAYGNIFMDRAKVLLGSMLGVPSRETIIAFVLMCYVSFANDCESEMWTLTGLAVRMSYDLGLHLNPRETSSSITAEESRLDRLLFWSVLIMDFALSYGVGRQTTFHLEDITQELPTEEDVRPAGTSYDMPRSPFPFAAKQMLSYGPLINLLNSNKPADLGHKESLIQSARAAAIAEYNQLPQDMQWNVGNLQRHNRANQGPIFLQLHLWMHLVLASEYLTDGNFFRRNQTSMGGGRSGAATPNSTNVSSLWRNSARTIGDILVLSDIINPHMYFALPFVNQAFYVAGCCYVKEIETHQSSAFHSTSRESTPPAAVSSSLAMTPIPSQDDLQDPTKKNQSQNQNQNQQQNPKQAALSRALLTSVATNNISTLQQGLAKQTTYWSGVAWVAGALAQRIEGIELQDVDLDALTGKLGSSVTLPDVGSLPNVHQGGELQESGNGSMGGDGDEVGFSNMRTGGTGTGLTPNWLASSHGDQGVIGNGNGNGAGNGYGQFDLNDLEFLSLPFDTGSVEGAQDVTELDVPLQMLQADWFRLPSSH